MLQEYLDKVVDANNPPRQVDDREEVAFTGPVDSVYLKAKDYVELDVGTGAAVAITSNNWNGAWGRGGDATRHSVLGQRLVEIEQMIRHGGS